MLSDLRRVRAVLLGAVVAVSGCASDLPPPSPYDVWAGPLAVTKLAELFGGEGLAVDAGGDVYVVAQEQNVIFAVTPAGAVSVLAGTGSAGTANGAGSAASFDGPVGVAVDAAGTVYVADTFNNMVRAVTPQGEVSTLAGTGAAGAANGAGSAASFDGPFGVAVDTGGNVYVADSFNNLVRKVTFGGEVSTLAGTGTAGSDNGAGNEASFSDPSDVAVDAAGNVYVADTFNDMVRKVTPAGEVSTLASVDEPGSIAVDAAGNVYVTSSYAVVRVTPAGETSTYAASFGPPFLTSLGGITVDATGTVYVADESGVVSTLTPLGKGAVSVYWTIPIDQNEADLPIDSCTASATAPGQPTESCEGFASCTLTGLTSGVAYSIVVTADNDSAPTSPVTAVPN